MASLKDIAAEFLDRAVLAVENDTFQPTGGNLFLFNHLVEERGNAETPDKVLEFLITSRSVASRKMATIGLPRHMVGKDASDFLTFAKWAPEWSLPTSEADDVALMPFAGLRSHAKRKGWTWDTQEVTDGMLFKAGEQLSMIELGAFGCEPGYPDRLIAHQRPRFHPIRLRMARDGSFSVADAPRWLSGAPVVALDRLAESQGRFLVIGMIGSVETRSAAANHLRFTPAWTIRSAATEVFNRLAGGST